MNNEILLPGEIDLDDRDMGLIENLLDEHLRLATRTLQKIKHIRYDEWEDDNEAQK